VAIKDMKAINNIISGGFVYRTRDITVLGRLLLTSVYRDPVGGDEV
jgi:hypothetical protein